jgi:hypothetical protein
MSRVAKVWRRSWKRNRVQPNQAPLECAQSRHNRRSHRQPEAWHGRNDILCPSGESALQPSNVDGHPPTAQAKAWSPSSLGIVDTPPFFVETRVFQSGRMTGFVQVLDFPSICSLCSNNWPAIPSIRVKASPTIIYMDGSGDRIFPSR